MKWGIMATGSIAQKFASTVNRMTDEGEILQAVASRTKESAENFARQHRIPEVFDSYKAMAESDSVDVIYIATPNNMHYENVKMCLLAGKHVLCEKPFTTSVAQAQELMGIVDDLFSANREITENIQTISAITEEVSAHANETYHACEQNSILVNHVSSIVSSLNENAAKLQNTK